MSFSLGPVPGPNASRTNLKRRGSLSDADVGGQRSSSDESGSSNWSPPDTPTPIRYHPLPRKSRLQPGRFGQSRPRLQLSSQSQSQPQSQSQSQSKSRPRGRGNDDSGSERFSFTVPIPKRQAIITSSSSSGSGGSGSVRRSAYTSYRSGHGENFSSSASEDDGEATETEMDSALRGLPSDLPSPDTCWSGDAEGDEVDMSLSNIPPSPLPTPSVHSRKRTIFKGKKRMRDVQFHDADAGMQGWSDSVEDGDDEAETESMLDRKSVKFQKKSQYSVDVKMVTSYSSMGGICKRMDGLQASSTILPMNVDTDYPVDSKHPELITHNTAPKLAARPSRANRRLRTHKFKRGEQKRCFQQLTASEDPLVGLSIFRDWNGIVVAKPELVPDPTSMDISDFDDSVASDAEMNASSDIKVENADEVSEQLQVVFDDLMTSTNRTKVRACYERSLPLARVQLAAVDMQLSNPAKGIYRRPRYHAFPERMPGQHSTSHLHRSSPSSLLPVRRYLLKSQLRRFQAKDKLRSKPGRTDFGTCISGQAFLALLRTKRAASQVRRSRVHIHNERTKQGNWRAMIGTWWGHAEVVRMTNKWWLPQVAPAQLRLPPKTRDEVEVENILCNDDDDGSMATASIASPSPSSSCRAGLRTSNQAKKRAARDSEDERSSEVEERWARRNQLRNQELQAYKLTAQLVSEQREEAVRRRQTIEAAQARIAEMAERRRAEDQARQAEQEQEQIRAEELARWQREESARVAQIAAVAEQEALERERLQSPPSPVFSEISLISEPPEYEFPFYPVVIAPPAILHASPPAPVPRRAPVQTSPARSDILPDYLPDRYTNLSPPPPPPYNARTDCHTVIAPIFIEDEDEDGDDTEGEEDNEIELASASPLAPSRRRIRYTRSSSPQVIGAFPGMIHAPTPSRHLRQRQIDPVRAFEAALELEEGDVDGDVEAEIERETSQVEDGFNFNNEEEDEEISEEEQDVVPGGRVAAVFQRVFGLVWGGGGAARR
ncbi:hypothetical protein IAR55_003332 [Kwoniella newhampshirensis]|uniref:Uncharacterized protein n=1 Tax=Kwoniella newhampshirensis TaxID=1651941 RepID=A0AAW0YWS2_9TREE